MTTPSLLSFSEDQGMAVFTFLTSISLVESEILRQQLRWHLKAKNYPEAFLKMDRVHYLDSSGLGIFVALQQEFRGTTRLRFSGLRPNVRLVFEFSHLLTYFTVDDVSPSPPAAQDPVPTEVPVTPLVSSERQEFLAIEGKYILTEDGVRYCTQKQIPVKDLRLYRGAQVTGFVWTSVNTALLERFVTHGLLAGIELERTEFLDKRDQILRLTEVLFDGIAMKRFRPLLKLKLMEDDTYRQLTAKGVSPARLRSAVQAHSATIAGLKAEIEELVLRRSPGATRPKTGRLLNLLDDSVWFLLTQVQSTPGNRALRQRILEALVGYSGRLELSESIALNLMEFLQQAERAHFLNLAERDPFTRKNPQSIPEMLADPRFRDRLVAKAKLQNEYLVMNMNFDGNPHDSLRGLVIEITVRNKGIAGNFLRHESLSKQTGPAPGLEELWGEESLTTSLGDLGLMNLHALKELCREQGISLETDLTRDERSDETVASMKLVL